MTTVPRSDLDNKILDIGLIFSGTSLLWDLEGFAEKDHWEAESELWYYSPLLLAMIPSSVYLYPYVSFYHFVLWFVRVIGRI